MTCSLTWVFILCAKDHQSNKFPFMSKFQIDKKLCIGYFTYIGGTAEGVYKVRCHSRASNITRDTTHPEHIFKLLPAGRRYRSLQWNTTRLKNNFFTKLSPYSVNTYMPRHTHTHTHDNQVYSIYLSVQLSSHMVWSTLKLAYKDPMYPFKVASEVQNKTNHLFHKMRGYAS